MRPWRTVAASLALYGFWVLVAPGPTARAQSQPGIEASASSDASEQPPQRIGYGAMPGGLHVPSAETLPQGTVELALLSGFGYRKGLVSADHTFDRASGNIAVAYAPLPTLLLGLSLDGRYDRHRGTAKYPQSDSTVRMVTLADDSYVGDPHLLVRLAAPFGKVSVGGQLGVWLPGKNAPSIAGSAISVDARGLVSVDAGFGTVTVDAGFRLDNSANSVDKPAQLSVADRVSLGASDFSAVLAGASLRIPLGARLYVALEGSTDLFVGSGAPGPILRGSGLVGIAASDVVSIVAYLEGAKGPGISYLAEPTALVPYEPMITGGLGLQTRFGGTKKKPAGDTGLGGVGPPPGPRPPITVIETADVIGTVVDDTGKPVVGARVTIKLKNNTGTAISDDKGLYVVARLPIGKTVDGKTEIDDAGAEVSIEVANKKPSSTTLTLSKGANTVPQIALDPMLPPGQLRGLVRSVGSSRPIDGATVTIEPGGVTATTGADGKFTVDLPPGRYKLTVTAKGLAQQQLDVNIEQNGVAIKNIDMHK